MPQLVELFHKALRGATKMYANAQKKGGGLDHAHNQSTSPR
jgi:hypothetical protein